jgi:hypothetical protein
VLWIFPGSKIAMNINSPNKFRTKKIHMSKQYNIILFLAVILNCNINAQTIIINSNGTHSVVINNGNTATIVNPDGTHSTLIKGENTSLIVNPDGTHYTVNAIGKNVLIVNPDGIHSTVYNDSSKTIFFKSNKTDSLKANNSQSTTKQVLDKNKSEH